MKSPTRLPTTSLRADGVLLSMYGMGSGGAERVISIMANHWASVGVATRLVTWDPRPSFYPLDPSVQRFPLQLDGVSHSPVEAVLNNTKRMLALRRLVKQSKPQAVISFINKNNVRTVLACGGLSSPVIISERNETTRDPLSAPWRRLVALTYPRASRIVVQSDRARQQMPTRWPTVVIPNPVIPAPKNPLRAPSERRTLLAMGRLDPQKGFDLLIDAFSQLAPMHPDWDLVIYGEGDLRLGLERQISVLGLTNRIQLPGRTSSPSDEMFAAEIFVLSSRFEGFPNVLAEAMAHGMPVISFDCPNGPREMIQSGCNGILVPAESVADLTISLEKLICSPDQQLALSQEAVKITERFGQDQVMKMWEAVIVDAATTGRKC